MAPNVRYRDAVLFGTFSVIGTPLLESGGDMLNGAVGCDQFAAEVVNPFVDFFVTNTVAKYLLFQIVEQAIDKGILDHILPEEASMITTTQMKTLKVLVKHKLLDTDAILRFIDPTPTDDKFNCDKGWFAPYLFASQRTPVIPRSHTMPIIQALSPGLQADVALAHTLVSESAAVIALCNADPTVNIGCPRVVAAFTGIAPYRGMWSTSRRPGAATIHFYLCNGVPAVVIPATKMAPLLAWNTMTLAAMRRPGYSIQYHHAQICNYLDSIVDEGMLSERIKATGLYEAVLGRAVSMLLNGIMGLGDCPGGVLKDLDPERAGIVFFKY